MKALAFSVLAALALMTNVAHAKVAGKSPRTAKPVNSICAKAAKKFFEAALNSNQLEGGPASEANERSIRVVRTDASLNHQTFEIVYAAVNREVGFNMEGEWQTKAIIEAQMVEGDPICFVTGARFQSGLPKAIRFN